jgi:hypothetical protein
LANYFEKFQVELVTRFPSLPNMAYIQFSAFLTVAPLIQRESIFISYIHLGSAPFFLLSEALSASLTLGLALASRWPQLHFAVNSD